MVPPFRPAPRRGALSNQEGRFEPHTRALFDDGWNNDPAAEEDLAPLQTSETAEVSRSILNWQVSPDIGFDRSLNPYRGCEHGCIYCYARPTHARLGFSPGLDFESRLFFKPDAARLLDKELRAPSYKCAPLAIGTNTDPYQPMENRRQVMRSVLEVLEAFRHPVGITTKSAIVMRDIDILGRMAADGLAAVGMSLTTLDRSMARLLEPRASPPAARLAAIRKLSAAGIPVTIMVAPVIPGLTDHDVEHILDAAAEAGASEAAMILLKLPGEVGDLFSEWLHAHFPERASHVLSLIRDTRQGKLYDSRFFSRFTGQGAYAEMLAQRVRIRMRRLGLNGRRQQMNTSLFRPPPRPGDQMNLF